MGAPVDLQIKYNETQEYLAVKKKLRQVVATTIVHSKTETD